MPMLVIPAGLCARAAAAFEADARASSTDTRGVRTGDGILDCGAEKLILAGGSGDEDTDTNADAVQMVVMV